MYLKIESLTKISCLVLQAGFILFLTTSSARRLKPQQARDTNCHLPRECVLLPYDERSRSNERDDFFAIKCFSHNLTLENISASLDPDARWSYNCPLYNQTINRLFWQTENDILEAIDHYRFYHFLDESFGTDLIVSFLGLKGFYIRARGWSEEYNEPFEEFTSQVYMRLENSLVDFYDSKTQKLIAVSCQYLAERNLTTPVSILQTEMMSQVRLGFFAPRYPKQPVCPLLFSSSRINELTLADMIDSFHKTNLFRFSTHDETSYNPHMDTRISRLRLDNLQNVHIDASLLNKHVFVLTYELTLTGFVRSVDTNLFATVLTNTKKFHIDCARRLFHTQGVSWLASLNSRIDVDPTNSTQIRSWSFKVRYVNLIVEYKSYDKTIPEMLPDEDFCIYRRFPFRQLIVVLKMNLTGERMSTCTYKWLVQHLGRIAWPYREVEATVPSQYAFISRLECNFTKMLARCDLPRLSSPPELSTNFILVQIRIDTAASVMVYVRLLISCAGFVTNLIMSLVISNEKNAKLVRDKRHFVFLRVNSIVNVLVFAFDLADVVRGKIEPLYTRTKFAHSVVYQLYTMFTFFTTNALIYMSSISYIAFTLCRISLLGKEHGKLVTWISTTSLLTFLAISITASLVFNVLLVIDFRFNLDFPYLDYPYHFEASSDYKKKTLLARVYFGLHLLNSLFFSVVLVVVQLGVDIALVVRLKATLEGKMKSGKTEAQLAAQKKTDETAVKRAVTMVLLNASMNAAIKTLKNFKYVYQVSTYRFADPHKSYAHRDFLLLFDDAHLLGFLMSRFDDLLMISLATTIFFVYKFDKTFKECFQNIFTFLNKNQKTPQGNKPK